MPKLARVLDETPMKKLVSPAGLQGAAVFLASAASDDVIGLVYVAHDVTAYRAMELELRNEQQDVEIVHRLAARLYIRIQTRSTGRTGAVKREEAAAAPARRPATNG